MLIRTSLASALALAVLLGACQGNENPGPDEDFVTEEEVASPIDQPSPEAGLGVDSAPLSVTDIERWQRGMEAELEAVREAEAAMSRAQNAEDTLSAMMAANESSTLAAGARAAGVNDERYRFIRQNLSKAARHLTPLEQEMDISQMPDAVVEQFEQSRRTSLQQMSAVLPPDVLEALRLRAEELRRQDVALTQERMRAAGIGG